MTNISASLPKTTSADNSNHLRGTAATGNNGIDSSSKANVRQYIDSRSATSLNTNLKLAIPTNNPASRNLQRIINISNSAKRDINDPFDAGIQKDISTCLAGNPDIVGNLVLEPGDEFTLCIVNSDIPEDQVFNSGEFIVEDRDNPGTDLKSITGYVSGNAPINKGGYEIGNLFIRIPKDGVDFNPDNLFIMDRDSGDELKITGLEIKKLDFFEKSSNKNASIAGFSLGAGALLLIGLLYSKYANQKANNRAEEFLQNEINGSLQLSDINAKSSFCSPKTSHDFMNNLILGNLQEIGLQSNPTKAAFVIGALTSIISTVIYLANSPYSSPEAQAESSGVPNNEAELATEWTTGRIANIGAIVIGGALAALALTRTALSFNQFKDGKTIAARNLVNQYQEVSEYYTIQENNTEILSVSNVPGAQPKQTDTSKEQTHQLRNRLLNSSNCYTIKEILDLSRDVAQNFSGNSSSEPDTELGAFTDSRQPLVENPSQTPVRQRDRDQYARSPQPPLPVGSSQSRTSNNTAQTTTNNNSSTARLDKQIETKKKEKTEIKRNLKSIKTYLVGSDITPQQKSDLIKKQRKNENTLLHVRQELEELKKKRNLLMS